MLPRIRLVIAVAVVTAGIALSVAGAYGLSLMALRNSNQQWCTALDLLTRQKIAAPANPAANPSREEQYRLYTDFVDIEHRFGCLTWNVRYGYP